MKTVGGAKTPRSAIFFFSVIRKMRRKLNEIRGEKCYLSTCSAMTFNFRRHDVTSIEHIVNQY